MHLKVPILPLMPTNRHRHLKDELIELFSLMGFACEPGTQVSQLASWGLRWRPELARQHSERIWELLGELGFIASPNRPQHHWYRNGILIARDIADAANGQYLLQSVIARGTEIEKLWYFGTGPDVMPDLWAMWEQSHIDQEAPHFITGTGLEDPIQKILRSMGFVRASTLAIVSQPFIPFVDLALRRHLGADVIVNTIGQPLADPLPSLTAALEAVTGWVTELTEAPFEHWLS